MYKVGDRVEFILRGNELHKGTILRIEGIFKNKVLIRDLEGWSKDRVVSISKKDILGTIKEQIKQ